MDHILHEKYPNSTSSGKPPMSSAQMKCIAGKSAIGLMGHCGRICTILKLLVSGKHGRSNVIFSPDTLVLEEYFAVVFFTVAFLTRIIKNRQTAGEFVVGLFGQCGKIHTL